jgi:hypothetical protein
MRKIAVLAAMLAVLGMASQAAEAGDRRVGLRHSSLHVGGKLHGFKFHRPGFFGKRSIVRFGEPRLFKPRHFSRFGHSGLVFKFSDGTFALRFSHVPHFKPIRLGMAAVSPNSAIGCISSRGTGTALPSSRGASDQRTLWASTIAGGAPIRPRASSPFLARAPSKRF